MYTYTEGMVKFIENKLFVFNVINVLALDDLMLLHRLDGISLARCRP